MVEKISEMLREPALAIACTSCGNGYIHSELNSLLMVALTEDYRCPHCGNSFQALEAHLRSLKRAETDFFASSTYALIGGNICSLRYRLTLNERKHLDFGKFGIPDDARILRVDQTSCTDGAEPSGFICSTVVSEYYSNNIILKNGMYVLGVGVGCEDKCSDPNSFSDTSIDLMIRWLAADNVKTFYPIFSALQSFYNSSFPEAIVFASASVERELYGLCATALDSVVGKKKIKDFLENQCTFSGQINVLCRAICKWYCLGKIPDELLTKLNKLRSHRNDAAHRAELSKNVSRDDVYQLVCVAIFATHLFRAMKLKISGDIKEAENLLYETNETTSRDLPEQSSLSFGGSEKL